MEILNYDSQIKKENEVRDKLLNIQKQKDKIQKSKNHFKINLSTKIDYDKIKKFPKKHPYAKTVPKKILLKCKRTATFENIFQNNFLR